ncbi:hypothetical protein BD626DRAFT_535200 [Schizophyllum amplum]|uniref:Uncharacterized protein n=1 Tax=Schizophyllum amplum TaxID=97359 RepID=A0A550CR86_9AGAR|nr:hypothetical protein BD626DRAFT_535200 [Auriculariopsis ampla]
MAQSMTGFKDDGQYGALFVGVHHMDDEQLQFLRELAPSMINEQVPEEVNPDGDPPSHKHTQKVAIWEWLQLLFAMKAMNDANEACRFSFASMSYNRYVQALINPKTNRRDFDAICQVDLVFGGPALNENFRRVVLYLRARLQPSYTHISSNSDPEYCVPNENALYDLIAGLRLVEQSNVVIFPGTLSTLYGGNKVQLHKNLDDIALRRDHARPRTVHADHNAALSHKSVYKRSYSARSDAVYVNTVDGIPTRTQDTTSRGVTSHSSSQAPAPAYGVSTGFELLDHGWLAQTHLPLLKMYQFGELRVWIVGGKISRVIQTCPLPADEHDTTGLFSEFVRHGCPPTKWAFEHASALKDGAAWGQFASGHHTPQIMEEGRKELEDFVLTVYRDLVAIEREALMGHISDIELMCRFDVGIMKGTDSFHYYVSEVERSPTTCMWGWYDWAGASADINTVARMMPDWIARHRALPHIGAEGVL